MQDDNRDQHPPLLVGLGEILWDMLPGGRQFGGAPANVACHARQLGLRSALISAVGDDALGREAVAELANKGIATDGIISDADHPTGTAVAEIDAAGKSSFTITEGVAWDHLRMNAPASAVVEQADVVCFGTLAQRSPDSRATIQELLAAVRPGALVVFDVNLRQHYFDVEVLQTSIARSTVVKVSDDEWPTVARLLDLPVDPQHGADQLRQRHDLALVALTCGANGSALFTRTQQHAQPAFPTTVVDTIGAGDSFTATLITGWLRGLPLERLHAAASRVSAYVCSQAGATPTLPDDLVALVR